MSQDPPPRPSPLQDAAVSPMPGTVQPDDDRPSEAPRDDDAPRATNAAQKEQDRQMDDGTETPG